MTAQLDHLGYPIDTDTGIRCGTCRGRHANVATVKACAEITHHQDETIRAEQAAELANLRALEDRGYWDARAQEDHEARHGVVSFADAYRAACPELFTNED